MENDMSYNVFVRNWWKENDSRPGQLEPDPGAERKYLKYGLATEAEAQTMAKEYNATHDPGRLSRKAEYEQDPAEIEYNGYPNYATWNVALWIDNEYSVYQAKMSLLRGLTREVTAKDVIKFVHTYLGGTTPDLNARDMNTVNYVYLAGHFETERLEDIAYANS
jgi:hypothetical protein